MKFFISRLREPSTYAGMAALAGAFGLAVPNEWVQSIGALGVAVGGVLAVVMPENKP
jgi:hypothetical protein